MERLSKEQIEAVIQEAKERCPYYGEPDGCNAHGGPLMCCDELDEVGELAKAACALGSVAELSALAKARDEGRMVVLDEPRKSLVWGDNDHDTCLCPDCGEDLMGIPYGGERMVLQCPVCGQYLDATKIITRAEAEGALNRIEV